MKYVHRQLSKDDVEILGKLLHVFGEAFGDPETYQGAVPREEYLRTLLGKQHVIVLAAFDDRENVVGGLVAYELEKFERERSELYIYDLAVAEPHRRKGIATMLVNALKAIAKERGAYVLFVQADAGDTAAIQLYESMGTREDVHHFDISVTNGST